MIILVPWLMEEQEAVPGTTEDTSFEPYSPAWTLFRRPRLFPLAVIILMYSFHFRLEIRRHVV
jgi:hypothetical protein